MVLWFSPLAFPEGLEDLQPRIDRAIEAGKEALLRRLKDIVKGPGQDYPMGRIALPLVALLKAGADPDSPALKAAIEKLESLELEKTYSVALYLLALDALAKSSHQGRSGPGTGKTRTKMEDLVRWLVDARSRGRGSWTYEKAEPSSRGDFSNTQFAVLGLQVGLEHGIQVPPEVFTEVIKLFTQSMAREGESLEIELTAAAPPEAKLAVTRVVPTRRYRVSPGGWGYTPASKKGEKSAPYPSMTAAGVSSLLIAVSSLKPKKPPLEAERTLEAGYAWITKHFDLYLKEGKQFFYTLYSLEKVGDLGQIERFGLHDWYREGATKLLDLQRKEGGWGSYVDTSFALLFLTRATELFEVTRARALLSGGPVSKPQDGDHDLVYLARAQGFVSARKFFRYLEETRRPDLLPAGQEIVRGYEQDAKEDLAPALLSLWRKDDKITAFAKQALVEITGMKSTRREDYAEWIKGLEEVRSLESKAALVPSEVAALIKGTESLPLKRRLVRLAQRKGLRSIAGLLIEELSVKSSEYRRTLHGILELWTGAPVRAPAADAARGTAKDSPDAGWEDAVKEWQSWWRANEEAWLRKWPDQGPRPM
jgi:hypothetical protein